MPSVYLATTNSGKLREFREAGQSVDFQSVAFQKLGVSFEMLPALQTVPAPVEDGDTFEANARLKAEYYSRFAPGELVLAEDSGLAVDELGGAPGVYSARYAAVLRGGNGDHENSNDDENNRALVSQLERLPEGPHPGKYVCVIALARDGKTLQTFTGEARGELLTSPRGNGGFGYDPYFYFPALGQTFAELSLEEKARHSHRGAAIRQFLAAFPKVISNG